MNRKTIYILFVLLLFGYYASAQQARRVTGTFTYYAEADESVKDAKAHAAEGARIQALASAFGTAVSQSVTQTETLSGGRESQYFSSFSESEVMGEWLEDTEEPEFEVSYANDMLVVRCKVRGMARELTNEAVPFKATVLRNGTDERFADVRFKAGDAMYVSFEAPADGYAAIYFVDESGNAYCLLPYDSSTDGLQKVKRNRRYVFFSQAEAEKGSGEVDEFVLTCDGLKEHDRLYVIFSPKPFGKAADNYVAETLPRQLPFADFQKWLISSRRRDRKMGVSVMHIEIENNQ